MSRILVVHASVFGAGAQLADLAGESLGRAGAQVRVRRVTELAFPEHQHANTQRAPVVTADDLAWADGFVFCSPSHTGLLSASMKVFVDQNHDHAVAGAYKDKTFTALATSSFAHAGQERVVENLNAIAAAWGCILVPPSTANLTINKHDGNPYGLSFVLPKGRLEDLDTVSDVLDAHFGRFVRITEQLHPAPVEPEAPTPIPTAADVFGGAP